MLGPVVSFEAFCRYESGEVTLLPPCGAVGHQSALLLFWEAHLLRSTPLPEFRIITLTRLKYFL